MCLSDTFSTDFCCPSSSNRIFLFNLQSHSLSDNSALCALRFRDVLGSDSDSKSSKCPYLVSIFLITSLHLVYTDFNSCKSSVSIPILLFTFSSMSTADTETSFVLCFLFDFLSSFSVFFELGGDFSLVMLSEDVLSA
ncbi:unnamed protein product [Chrysodeixis includens]|uniref:Uncharacterized protein n=1 Tax=Chrysodeixis includens TaxID=689277 RepID=A0A9P0FVR4_CHRIL|nr:unnamed protein product [Chrysodeixis includens]